MITAEDVLNDKPVKNKISVTPDQKKEKELKKLNEIASWQYYENWGWDRGKPKK